MRFLAYGALGWCLEILFTGLASAFIDRNRAAVGRTYLWMLPIYGATGLLLEIVHRALALPFLARMPAYLLIIYLAELSTGRLLRWAIGVCPWDYTGRGLNVRGLIRLDYLPAWLLVALLFEAAERLVRLLAALLAT